MVVSHSVSTDMPKLSFHCLERTKSSNHTSTRGLHICTFALSSLAFRTKFSCFFQLDNVFSLMAFLTPCSSCRNVWDVITFSAFVYCAVKYRQTIFELKYLTS